MKHVYLDASALVKRFRHELESEVVNDTSERVSACDPRHGASQAYCWYSWTQQAASMAKLQDFAFTWVLPGHGQRIHLPREHMSQELRTLVHRMH